MRVFCERRVAISGEARGSLVDSGAAPWPRIGEEYTVYVIQVDATPPRGLLPSSLLLLDETRTPVWLPSAMFSVSSGRIPTSWRVHLTESGDVLIGPEPVLDESVLARLHEGDTPDAREARAVLEAAVKTVDSETG